MTRTHPSRGDLARYALSGEPTAERHAAVRAHLQGKCGACQAILAECLAAREQMQAAAAEVASWVRPERVECALGQRSAALADHQLVCSVGPYELDVLVREVEGAPLIKYQGQITLSGRIHEPAADLSLCLVEAAETQTLLGTHTNEFGEFVLSSRRDGCFGLRVGDEPDAPCVLVWDGWAA